MNYELYENEVVMLLLGVCVLVFILVNRQKLKKLPASNILFVAFYTMLVAWILTVLEGFFYEWLLNFIEHLCHAVSSLFVAVWCWMVFGRKSPVEKEAL